MAVLTGAVALVAVLAACAGGPLSPQPRSTAVPVEAVVCADPFGETALPEAGLPPDGFDAVAVVRCDPYATETDGGDVWSGVATERFEGDLGPFLAAISAPSDARWPGPCTADMMLVPDLWLVDAEGRAVRLSYPVTGCGKPKAEGVDDALAGLRMAERTFHRVVQEQSAAAAASGCPTRAGVLVVAGGLGEQRLAMEPSEPGAIAAPGVVALAEQRLPAPAEVTGLHVCAYAADATDGGAFVQGVERDAATAGAVLALIATAARPAPACDAVATSFVTLAFAPATSAVPSATLELDGCGRLIDPALRALAAPPELAALVTPLP